MSFTVNTGMCLTWSKCLMQKEFPKWVPYARLPHKGPSTGTRQGLRYKPLPHIGPVLALPQLVLFKQDIMVKE